MNQYSYKDLEIEVYNEPNYTSDSTDNKSIYLKHYYSHDAKLYPASKHGIKIYRNGEEINNCIITGSGGATGIYEGSSVLDKDQLLICCGDTIFSLSLPDLQLKWATKSDTATCFMIRKHQGDYIVYGELQISRLNSEGQIKWQFGGRDIFVSLNGKETFKINEDHIALTDFSDYTYKIDFNGEQIKNPGTK